MHVDAQAHVKVHSVPATAPTPSRRDSGGSVRMRRCRYVPCAGELHATHSDVPLALREPDGMDAVMGCASWSASAIAASVVIGGQRRAYRSASPTSSHCATALHTPVV